MDEHHHSPYFWLGNGLLAIALIMLIFISSLWAALGSWAMILWMLLAGVGFYLVTRDKGPNQQIPD